jgi:hypothetical protein
MEPPEVEAEKEHVGRGGARQLREEPSALLHRVHGAAGVREWHAKRLLAELHRPRRAEREQRGPAPARQLELVPEEVLERRET